MALPKQRTLSRALQRERQQASTAAGGWQALAAVPTVCSALRDTEYVHGHGALWFGPSDGRFAKNENDSIRFSTTNFMLFDKFAYFFKPVNDNVYVSISPVCL